MPIAWTDPETGEEHLLRYAGALAEELAAFDATECQHEATDWRRATYATGAVHIRRQCLSCGELIGSSISKSSAPPDCKDHDREKLDQYRSERRQTRIAIYRKHVKLQAQEQAGLSEEYAAAYLDSPEWKKKRSKVMERANGLCEGCRERPATIIHHLTYEHIMDELLFELVALCKGCHDKCHPEVARSEHGSGAEVDGDDELPW